VVGADALAAADAVSVLPPMVKNIKAKRVSTELAEVTRNFLNRFLLFLEILRRNTVT
jgi:hypothetical protein